MGPIGSVFGHLMDLNKPKKTEKSEICREAKYHKRQNLLKKIQLVLSVSNCLNPINVKTAEPIGPTILWDLAWP